VNNVIEVKFIEQLPVDVDKFIQEVASCVVAYVEVSGHLFRQ